MNARLVAEFVAVASSAPIPNSPAAPPLTVTVVVWLTVAVIVTSTGDVDAARIHRCGAADRRAEVRLNRTALRAGGVGAGRAAAEGKADREDRHVDGAAGGSGRPRANRR